VSDGLKSGTAESPGMDTEATVRAYYDALRAGDPLPPFFAADDALVKVGISERLVGHEAVARGLREQTAHTDDWTVESRDLRVTERDGYAWFADSVRMAWTDTDTGSRHDFESRWSGSLENRDGWVFVGMHVSAPHELSY
jgi:hypothetical protein